MPDETHSDQFRALLKAQPRSFRDAIRQKVGPNGDKLWEWLTDMAEGKAWQASLPDGRISAPLVPSSDVRLRATIMLAESLFGRAVPQTEVVKAEEEATTLASVRALSDEELAAEARRILGAGRPAIDPGPEADAIIVEDPETLEYTADEKLFFEPSISTTAGLSAFVWGDV